MWDLPGPALQPMFPALAGRFLTTAPPGNSLKTFLKNRILHECPVDKTNQKGGTQGETTAGQARPVELRENSAWDQLTDDEPFPKLHL